MKKPNLFLVGVPRSGTTSLYRWLKQTPGVFMSEIKGPDFFSEHPNKDNLIYWKNEKKYLSLFKNAENQKVVGEASHYFHQSSVPKKIKKFSPKSKIVILLRNPFSVIKSYYNGGTIPMNIDIRDRSSLERLEVKELFENLSYYENIKRWFDIFDKKNVHIIITEKLKENPLKEWKKLMKFLGLKSNFIPEFKIENKSIETKNKWILSFTHSLGPSLKITLKKILGKKTSNNLRTSIIKKTTKDVKKEPLKKEIKKYFKNQLFKEISKTSKLLGINLDFWKIDYNNI